MDLLKAHSELRAMLWSPWSRPIIPYAILSACLIPLAMSAIVIKRSMGFASQNDSTAFEASALASIAIAIASNLIVYGRTRSKNIRNRSRRESDDEFLLQLGAPFTEHACRPFAIAVRASIAAAYAVEKESILASDTGRSLNQIGTLHGPIRYDLVKHLLRELRLIDDGGQAHFVEMVQKAHVWEADGVDDLVRRFWDAWNSHQSGGLSECNND